MSSWSRAELQCSSSFGYTPVLLLGKHPCEPSTAVKHVSHQKACAYILVQVSKGDREGWSRV